VLDLSNPTEPRVVGGNAASGHSLTVANGKLFVAGPTRLTILHLYQPLRFEQIARQENSTMRLRIAGPPGVPGRVQRSADLRTGVDWLPVNFGESSLETSDSEAASAAAGFYRLAVP
jgi:hypothetical protein